MLGDNQAEITIEASCTSCRITLGGVLVGLAVALPFLFSASSHRSMWSTSLSTPTIPSVSLPSCITMEKYKLTTVYSFSKHSSFKYLKSNRANQLTQQFEVALNFKKIKIQELLYLTSSQNNSRGSFRQSIFKRDSAQQSLKL